MSTEQPGTGTALALSSEEAIRLGRTAAEDARERAPRQARVLTQLFTCATHEEITSALSELGGTEAAGVELLLILLERRIPPEERGA